MMKHKTLILIGFLLSALSGCDWGEQMDYIVKNSTSREIIIRTPPQSWRFLEIKDSIHFISPGEELRIVRSSGLCGRNFVPDDLFRDNDTIPWDCEKFEVWVNDECLSEQVRLRKYWSFSAKKYWGGYLLDVNEKLIDLLKNDE